MCGSSEINKTFIEQGTWLGSSSSSMRKYSLNDERFTTREYSLGFDFYAKTDYHKYKLIFQGAYIQLNNVNESDGEPYTKDGNCTDWVCFYGLEDCESTTLCYPNYIHELQNLYFALTGEELELKTETKP